VVNNFGSRILRSGSSGDDVKVLQNLLNYLPDSITGPDLVVDGDFGPKTQAAVKKFQTYFGLSSDGIVGKNTFLYLGQPTGSFASGPVFGSRVLRKGISGRDVWILQNRLASTAKKYAIALGGPADSIFGSKTEAAVKLFQKDKGLTADGIVGNKTFYQLYLNTFMGGRLLQRTRSDRNQGLDVFALQSKLKDLGYSPGALDGQFGPLTEAALKKFQTAAGITADGVAGPITYYNLGLKGA
jgi:peptidoglycan hydrolase-like protein with peptidoglycan-binding domain